MESDEIFTGEERRKWGEKEEAIVEEVEIPAVLYLWIALSKSRSAELVEA
jgi:hypothetical protein